MENIPNWNLSIIWYRQLISICCPWQICRCQRCLKKDFNNVRKKTKLTLVNTDQLIELCVSKCYFLDNILTWKIYNLGPIGFSIMVIPTECYLKEKKTQRLEEKSITLSSALNVSPKTFKRYVDGSHARFENK